MCLNTKIERSLLEGWMLSERGDGYYQIQKDDENDRFESDFEAYVFVLEMADVGSEYHATAVARHGRPAASFGE